MDFVNQATLDRWQRRTGNAPAHIRAFVERVGAAMLLQSLKNMDQMIYAIPEDVRPRSGKKKWTRTSTLFQGERLEFAPDRSGVTLKNSVEYAHARHELGRDGRQTKRPAHWRDPIIRQIRGPIDAEMQTLGARVGEGR